ncbi:MAG: hypothetical protein EU539_02270 [Promethearchaeota archaeon]|nr:MAG: hypothetical protein EU539_02270 [Candidatus Lokiarchaeota archaeon]
MTIVGIPSDGPELSDQVSEHFGHCAYFVGVEVIDDMTMKKSFSKKNNGHSSCLEPVLDMKKHQVTDMIVGGIGGRPYMGFLQEGINLYQAVKGTIKHNVKLFMQGMLKSLGGASCAGSQHAQ